MKQSKSFKFYEYFKIATQAMTLPQPLTKPRLFEQLGLATAKV